MYIQSVDCHVYYEKYLLQNFHDINHIISSLIVLNIEIYIKNIGYQNVIDKSTYVSISLGTSGGTTQEISKLYGGDWLMVPLTGIDATGDVYATASTNDAVVLEYVMYYEEN